MWSEVNGTLGNVRWSHVRCPWNKLVTENAKENAKRFQSLTPWLTITKDVLRWELIVYLGNGRKRVRPRSEWSKVLQKFFVAPHLEYLDIIMDWKVLVIGECLVLETVRQRKDCDQLISQLCICDFQWWWSINGHWIWFISTQSDDIFLRRQLRATYGGMTTCLSRVFSWTSALRARFLETVDRPLRSRFGHPTPSPVQMWSKSLQRFCISGAFAAYPVLPLYQNLMWSVRPPFHTLRSWQWGPITSYL